MRAEVYNRRIGIKNRYLETANVRRDLVQPGAQRRSGLEAPEAAPGAEQRFLQRAVGVVKLSEHAIAVQVKTRAIWRDQLLERLRISRLRGREDPSLALREPQL